MKTKKSLLVACFVGLALTFGIAGASLAGMDPGTGIVGSKHDMNSVAPDDYGRVCAFCHTPHHAVKDIDPMTDMERYAPLWSRELTALEFPQTYYSETLTDEANFSADPLVGPSRLCMGCHDGVVAIDAYYGSGGDTNLVGGDAFPSDATVGTLSSIGIAAGNELSNDHPIGFLYDTVAGKDAEIKPSSSVFPSGKGVKVSDVLYQGYMTCATCHDVHNSKLTVDQSDANSGWFLYGPQTGSAFCLTCHDK